MHVNVNTPTGKHSNKRADNQKDIIKNRLAGARMHASVDDYGFIYIRTLKPVKTWDSAEW